MSSRILVPVDFTKVGHNAYRYALHLAHALGYDVVLAHYYSGSVDPRANLTIAGDGSIQGSFTARLRQYAYGAEIEPPTGVEVAYETGVALSPSAAIIERAHEDDIRLVVMPPRSTPALLGRWLGSTATTVSEACDRPVFFVPPDARYQALERLVVANNHNTAGVEPLRHLHELAGHYGSDVHFIHVRRVSDGPNPFQFVPAKLTDLLSRQDDPTEYPFRILSVEDDDISRGLMYYAAMVDAQAIVIVNQLRSRWRALLKATLTQDLALRSPIPVLVLHTTEKEPSARSGRQVRSIML